MPSQSPEIDELQRQMQRVRTSLGVEVHDLVENARAITDWRRYWRSHPWAWCGAAAILGYVVVPSRRFGQADVGTLAELSRAEATRAKATRAESNGAEATRASAASAAPPRRRGVMADLTGMAIGFVVQRGMQVLGRKLEGLLNSRTASSSPPSAGSERRQEQL